MKIKCNRICFIPTTKNISHMNDATIARHVGRILKGKMCDGFKSIRNRLWFEIWNSRTFFGNISVRMMYGIGIRPMLLRKTMEAKQNGGIHSNAGCFNHSKQYAPNKKKLAAVNNEDPMYKVCEYKNQKRMIERNVLHEWKWAKNVYPSIESFNNVQKPQIGNNLSDRNENRRVICRQWWSSFSEYVRDIAKDHECARHKSHYEWSDRNHECLFCMWRHWKLIEENTVIKMNITDWQNLIDNLQKSRNFIFESASFSFSCSSS